MLFAAGFGTRMGELTRSRPKPLIPVAGRALLDHALDLAAGAGLSRQVVNAHYLAEQVVAHLDGRGIPVAVETPEILDTGGGLRAALPLLGPGPVFTLNTDAVWTGPNPLVTLAGAWDPARMDALLLLMRRYCDEQLVNVGSGEEVSIAELAKLIADVAGYRGAIRFDTSQPDGTPRKLLDSSRIRALGWQPSVGLRSGLQSTYSGFDLRQA